MRYLLAIWDGGGATPPNLGVARILVERGHEVVVFGDATLEADVVETGATYRTWPTAPQRRSTRLEDDLLKDWECRTPLGAARRILDRLIAGPSTRFAADVTAALDDEQFDAVLADGMLLGALIGAEARGIPAATLVGSVYLAPSRVRPPMGRIPPARGAIGRMRDRISFALVNLLWHGGIRSLNDARAEYGLDPLAHLWDQWDRADRVLMLTASVFDDPPPDAPNVRYVGPVLEDIPTQGALELPPGDNPLIVVGLSSSYMEQSDLLRRIAQALSQMPVRGIITTGPAVDPFDVPAADNVLVVRAAAHTELIPKADLVITHAGHGTLVKAIAAGVPALCIPLGRDQPDNAARAKRHGVAVVLSPRSDAATITKAIRQMLSEPSYRAAADALGAQIRAEIASGALLAELESLPAAHHLP
ncbi:MULTISPECIES: glycosyltransferase [unclassified Microbacterium]|uniref:glycosyltransferase n=1 Tax=unclassified Microbacterium TaxID=2609290 RepID=UPI00214B4A83|nr:MULTISPECIES: glycosyltransferase [unclassified Microbacterium]MCR2809933.1 glycosyltransferase [Microbacterium sp. zg.B185]WIM17761.1 glycosyltransferase [Microbacterium sp. zg-B185]